MQFQDEMKHGPFQKWLHTHTFAKDFDGGCIMEDRIDYSMLPIIGKFGFINNLVQGNLNRLFEYRHELLKNDLTLLNQTSKYQNKNILIAGSNGLIGSALIPLLQTVGNHNVVRLTRPSSTVSDLDPLKSITWDPYNQNIDLKSMNGFDTIIHLGGVNIFGRWTKSKKEKIRNSRLESTKLLCEGILNLDKPPSTFICASAIGYYGNRGQEILTEESKAGEGFISDLCKDWEYSCKPLLLEGDPSYSC